MSDVYSIIGSALTNQQLGELVKKTGLLPTDIYNEEISPREKVEKTIDKLKHQGNERWLLTWVLIQAAENDDVRRAIVKAFPDTLSRLPLAKEDVTAAIDLLRQIAKVPLSEDLKYDLRPKKERLSTIAESIVTLFAYRKLHEDLLKLIFALSVSETLLAAPSGDISENFETVVEIAEAIVTNAPKTIIAFLGDTAAAEAEWIDKLESQSKALKAVLDAGVVAVDVVDKTEEMLREKLLELNDIIFASIRELSVDALPDDLPSSSQTDELRQAVRNAKITVLARAFKTRLWHQAEDQIARIGKKLHGSRGAINIANEWLGLRPRIDWLAGLEPDESWASEARKHASNLEKELLSESDDEVIRLRFEEYRNWFRVPFEKIDTTLGLDCGALREIDDPLREILKDLTTVSEKKP